MDYIKKYKIADNKIYLTAIVSRFVVLYVLFFNYQLLEGQYLFLEDNLYSYLDYLHVSQQYSPKYYHDQPYDLSDYKSSSELLSLLHDRGFSSIPSLNSNGLDLHFNGGIGVTNRNKLDHTLNMHSVIRYKEDNYIFVNKTGMNRSYLFDVYYPGELSESEHWIYGMVENAYFKYSNSKINIFLGRVFRNWGPITEKSLILSNNPYPYDHLYLSFENSLFKISTFATRLNKEDSAFTYHFIDSTITSFQNVQRFLAGHRIDFRIGNKLQISFTEMAIFGGVNKNFDYSFLVPTNLYYDLQRNTNKSMSGLWAIDIQYRVKSKTLISAQLLIDDIIINNDPGINDRAKYPDRMGLICTIKNADRIFDGLFMSINYIKVWNYTYHSRDSWENYHYKGLRLGYPFSSSEEIKLKIGYWGFKKMWMTYLLGVGRFGSIDVRDVFTLKKESFPISPISSSLHQKLIVQYNLSSKFTITAKIETFSDLNSPYATRFTNSGLLNCTIEIKTILSKEFWSS
jgi:hypothetical protein